MAQRLRALSWKKIWAQFLAPPWQPTTVHYSNFKGSYYDCPLWAPEPCVMQRHTFEKNTHIHKILKHFKGFLVNEGGVCIWVSVCTCTHVSVCGCVHVKGVFMEVREDIRSPETGGCECPTCVLKTTKSFCCILGSRWEKHGWGVPLGHNKLCASVTKQGRLEGHARVVKMPGPTVIIGA